MSYGELAALKEECGVVAAYGTGADLPGLLYVGLFALQHRGEESAGIAVSNGQQIALDKGLLYRKSFLCAGQRSVSSPTLGIGHVRYSTCDGRSPCAPFIGVTCGQHGFSP